MKSITRATLASFALTVLALGGCKNDRDATATTTATEVKPGTAVETTKAATPAPAAPAALRMKPKGDQEMPTTSAAIYLGNLDAQIGELVRLSKAAPTDASRRRMLSGLRYARAKVYGDLDGIALATADADASIAIDPRDPDGYLTRADQEQALHRFARAQADVTLAKTLDAKPEAVAGAVQELDWNGGRYDAAIAAIHAASARHATVWTVAREAQLHHDLGEEVAADRDFEKAEDLIVDTNPVPVAWLNVQRGIHETKVGKLELAVTFFREAARRVPAYVAAREHLAETLHALGQDEEAVAIYEGVVKDSPDPEFQGALAAIYRAKGRVKEADALHARATAAYAKLLATYPEAMYWHASEYFLGEGGDARKALALLRKNTELRPNATSYAALAKAALAAQAPDADVEARAAIDKALAMPLKFAELFWTAARVCSRAGDVEKAKTYEAQARALNGRIDRDEPAIGPVAKR